MGLKVLLDALEDNSFIISIYTEIFKALITFLFGYISFKIFERYRSKKDNNRLLIQLIKLEREAKENKKKIEDAIDEHIELELLLEEFKINNKFNESLYKLYSKINNLKKYICTEYDFDENGEIIDIKEIYTEKAYEMIDEMSRYIDSYDINDYDVDNDIDCLIKELEYYEKNNIYTEIDNIYMEIEKFNNDNYKMKEALSFLKLKIERYNSLSEEDKKRYLNLFCKTILEKENEFTQSLNVYKKIQYLEKKFKNDIKLKLDFKLWNEQESNLLAIYNAELYLELDDAYTNFKNFEISISNSNELEHTKEIIEKKLENSIKKHKNIIRKILMKNNRLFKGL